jgi:hypothetical protein
MYHYDKTQSDTSVSGWQVQALKAAHLTKLGLPGVDGALDRAMANFARVQGPNGGYGYRQPAIATASAASASPASCSGPANATMTSGKG